MARCRKRKRAKNRFHLEDLIEKPRYRRDSLTKRMSPEYKAALKRVRGFKQGRDCLKRYKSFIGIPFPTRISPVKVHKRWRAIMGMGRTPVVNIADGPRGKQRKIKKFRGKWTVACTPGGRQILIFKDNGKLIGKGLKFVGYAPETHYVLTKDQENAGSFKRGKYWVHLHHDEGGKWPKVYRDSNGNFIYGRGSYRIGRWIRR